MKKLVLSMLSIFGLALVLAVPSMACTSYYVGSECTKDGSTLYGRTEDINAAYDKVFKVIDAKNVGANATYTDPTGATSFSGPIKVNTTYRYTICRDSIEADDGYFGEVGVNSAGVSMSATTSASPAKTVQALDPYKKGTGITEENLVDYILCQASSARDGVEILANVIDTIGSGEGNGLFIADEKEVWYFEMLTGSTYCAIKMPSDKAAVIPNCLMIGDVNLSDTENVIASSNLVSFAKDNHIFVGAKTTGDINVKLTYSGTGYSAGNADRIRGGKFLLTGQDSEAIYTADYQDPFFDCSDVTVEKLYELAGYRYEGMNFGDRAISRYIGVSSSTECHIMQIRSDMPKELATVEWLSMSNADYSTFVPFYAAVMTDTSDAYKMEAYKYNSKSAYWIFRGLGALCEQDRTYYGASVKAFYKDYMTKMEEKKNTVDAQMKKIYTEDRENLEYYATQLGVAIGDETMDYANEMKGELLKYIARGRKTTPFATTVNTDNLVYDISMVAAPKKDAPIVTPTEVKAPAKAVITIKNVKKKKIKVKINKVAQAAGYEIAYSKNVNFRKSLTKTVTTKATVKMLKSVKKGRAYYVKVRAYRLDGTKKVYGSWSAIKRVKITK